MRCALAANLDREHSLEAMRHAFRASKFARRNYVEIDAGVVHALLNARYYESGRGQFISQDPVFWEIGLTNDGKSALLNPQALNSYGYANDNPITNKDPSGRCGEPVSFVMCLGVIGAGAASIGTY